MPIEPVNPSKKTGGDGNEKYTPNEKRGPGEFDKILEKEKADRARAEVKEFINKGPKSTPKAYSDTGPRTGPTSGGFGGGDLEKGMMGSRMKKPSYCTGGKVKSASKRADGIAIRGKTRA